MVYDTNTNKEKIDDLATNKSTPDNSGTPTWAWILGIITIIIVITFIYFAYKDNPDKFVDSVINGLVDGLINSA